MEGVVDLLHGGLLAPGDWHSIAFVQVEGHLPFFPPTAPACIGLLVQLQGLEHRL